MDDCSPPSKKIETLRQSQQLTYPVNVGRNAARQASKTNFVLVSDIELIPSKGLIEQFANLLHRLTERRNSLLKMRTSTTWTGRGFVYVLPVFEVKQPKLQFYFSSKISPFCNRWSLLPPSPRTRSNY